MMKKGVLFLFAVLLLSAFAVSAAENVAVFASGLKGPENLAFDGKGAVYISDTDHLYRATMDGQKSVIYTREKDKDATSICGVTLGPEGKVYFSAGNRILVYDPASGAVKELVSGFSLANGNCMDDKGNLYIADSNKKILFIVPAGSSEARVLKDKAGWVNGMVWSRKDNTLYYTISSPGKVIAARLDDKPEIVSEKEMASFPLYGLDDMTIDDAGNLYVCIWMNHKIIRISPDGKQEVLLDKINGPSAVEFGVGDLADTLFICIKGAPQFNGTEVVKLKTEARGYRMPFVP